MIFDAIMNVNAFFNQIYLAKDIFYDVMKDDYLCKDIDVFW